MDKEMEKELSRILLKNERILSIIIILFVFGAVCLALWVGSYPESKGAQYPQIDQNITDQNITDANVIIQDTNTMKEEWCRKEYLHRKNVITINTFDRNTGKITNVTWQEAVDLNTIANGQFIPMENIEDSNGGIFCDGFIYYGVRAIYTRCLDFNTTLREDCFKLPTGEIATLPEFWAGERWDSESKTWK